MGKPKTPSQKAAYKRLNKRLSRYVAAVEAIYDNLNAEAAKAALRAGYTAEMAADGKAFRWEDYPQTKASIENLQAQYVSDMGALINRGTSVEWKTSNELQDLLATKAMSYYDAQINGIEQRVYYQKNNDALKAFQERKDKGMNLSEKLWEQSDDYRTGLEAAISTAIEKGTSAITLSKQISKYLQDFPLLKADYTEMFGHANNIHDCEYRSARLARSEINMAYRKAEQLRWSQMDFIVGYEIKTSAQHPAGDICNDLAGKYPKDFVWTGWHPNCMCYKIPIMKTDEEFWAYDGRGEADETSVNAVTEMPENFVKWVGSNADRISEARQRGTLPYFIKDNRKLVNDVINTQRILDSSIVSTASILGIDKAEPMSFKEADQMSPNPNFHKAGQYATNCASTAVAYELRRRGLDVESFGNSGTEWSMPFELGKHPEAAWLTIEGNIPTPKIIKAEISEGILSEAMKEEGRYQLWFKWDNLNTGHILSAERLPEGALLYYDAQRGNSATEFLFDFSRIDAAEGIRVLKLNRLKSNDVLISGIVKPSKSGASIPKMTNAQKTWWLENTEGATAVMGEFEPYSAEIVKRLRKCSTRAQQNELFESIAHGADAQVINENSKAFTTCYPKHKSMKGETWKDTKQMAIDLNNGGISVCFLPEYDDTVSADAIAKVGGIWKIADFKHSKSQKSNTIEININHAFEQAECCIIKVLKADRGTLCDALDYLVRNNCRVKEMVIINKYGKIKPLKAKDITDGRYHKILRGFL